ncbi:MAG TPA: FAD-dependent oxidoreductase [Vicinamibacteria bacterium]|nr:FAD-dependent oxidoreductase [Vicinamibacteria bacterium]
MTQPAAGRRSRIVVLGGGFAGIYTAMELEKLMDGRNDFEVVLINKENYFVFQPMLPEVISGTIGMLDVVSPIRRLLPRSDLHVREVESIDLEGKVVVCSPGFRAQPHVVPYDHLVLALGNVTDFRGMRGLAEHAFPFKNLGDALALRNHVIRALDEASIERHDERLRKQLLTFVVAGGGFSGVEVVAELNDFVREVARSYPALDPAEIRIVLLHAGARILPEVAESLALFAQKILIGRGVEIRFNTMLEAATGDEAILKGGERIPTKTLVSTVPSFPHPLLDSLALPKGKNGKLFSTKFMRVEGSTDVWALGDCAIVPMVDGYPSPPTAQHAIRQAAVAAHNIVATLRGLSMRTFDFKGLGKMGSLGRRSAVAELPGGLKISGFLAWWLWRTIYLMKLPGMGRRLRVASAWALDLFLPPELVQLKLGGSGGVTQEHFEPGQDVFRQGDLGDRVYIILNGAAEVWRTAEGTAAQLGRLGPGDWFGEMALLNQTTRGATVRCVEAMDALSLPKRDFTVLAANLPDLRKSFERVMETRRAPAHDKSVVSTGR